VNALLCPKCKTVNPDGSNYCIQCGIALTAAAPIKTLDTASTMPPISTMKTAPPTTASFLIVTTPTIAGYKITKVIGLVTGLTPRTRGVLGKFVAGFESLIGGEVTAFTSEMEKARWEAINRAVYRAQELGANAIVGMDVETSDIGLQSGIVLFSATGTAVIIEPELSQLL
jgi:uncharacterized protein YbjQ (UPF0145 family)